MQRKTTKRYHSKKTGRYISRKQWLREGKKGKAKREKIVIGKRKPISADPKPKEDEIIERLRYQSGNRMLDIEVVSTNGKTKSIRIGRRTYTQRANIIRLLPIIEAARISSGNRKRKTRRK